jgi:TatA/E family protein of Tat protein translocase
LAEARDGKDLLISREPETPCCVEVPMNHILQNLISRPLLAWTPGWVELVIVLFIAMVLFGNRLPGTMRSLGQSLVQFKKGMREGDEESSGADKLQ